MAADIPEHRLAARFALFGRGDGQERERPGAGNAAIQIQGEFDDEWLTDRVVAITQLAEQLDRETLQLALRIVPVQWWAARLGDAHLGNA